MTLVRAKTWRTEQKDGHWPRDASLVVQVISQRQKVMAAPGAHIQACKQEMSFVFKGTEGRLSSEAYSGTVKGGPPSNSSLSFKQLLFYYF